MILKSSEKTDVNMTELVAEVDAATFEKAIDAVYRQQKKNISMPGFRKGKVPRKLCESTYGEGVFFEDALNLILNMEMPALIAEAELNLVDAPRVEVTSVSKAEGATVKIVCVTKPEIHIADYKGMTAPKNVKEITDEDVEKQAENLLKKNAKMVSVDDRAAEMGDEVTLDFEGFFGDTAFEGGKGEDFQLKLGSGQFIPGFEEQVAGHKIDEDFDVTVTFPEDYQMEDYAGKEAVFKCKIHAISHEEVPELTDDFVKEISDFDTIDEWKADTKKKMQENAEQTAQVGFENALIAKLIDKVEDPIPHCMFEQRADALMETFANQLKSQHVDMDLYLQYTGMTQDELKATYLDRAESEVKLRLALEKIAELEALEVSEEEMDADLTKLAEENNMTLEDVKARIPMQEYKVDMLVTKALDLVKESAIVDNTVAEAEEAATEEAVAE
ncbi:MAG: trigger factor [Oscillospiraceae bacterium]|nr:trigger factor [Oscillospiraceae bacterium]